MTRSRNEACLISGAHHSVTGADIRRQRGRDRALGQPLLQHGRRMRADRRDQPGLGSAGNRRLRHDGDGDGASARAGHSRRRARARPDRHRGIIRQPQPPHQQYRAQHAVLAPAPRRRGHAGAQGQRPANALEPRRQRHVLHQRDLRKAAHVLECRAGDEHGLVAGGDAGQARARVHHDGDQNEQAAAIDTHVEAAPDAARSGQTVHNQRVRILGQHACRRAETAEYRPWPPPPRRSSARRGRAGAVSTWSARGRARSGVPSRLPPSTTTISTPRRR